MTPRPWSTASTSPPLDALDPELRRIVERRASLLGPAYKLFYRNPVRVVRAEGVHLFDPDAQAYLDAYNNVPSVGHCHPRVTEAIARQAATLNTHTRYASELILDYAERLLGTYPAELGNVMFTCTGSEAVDLALRIARFFTGGEGTVITANAYHGVTTAAAEISPSLGPAVPLGRAVWTVAPPAAQETVQIIGRTSAGNHRRHEPARGPARGVHRGQPVLLRRDPAGPGGMPETGARRRARGRRPVHRQRGPAGFRPNRGGHVGLPAPRHRSRPGRHGQAHGQRHADRRCSSG